MKMDAFEIDESFFEELFRNDDDWVAKAFALDEVPIPAVAASQDAATAGDIPVNHSYWARPEAAITELNIIVCPTIESIPSGKQARKLLKCGVAGCTSNKLFDRKYELQRHMETHEDGKFPCLVNGCDRGPKKPFKREEHLRNHLNKIHG